jgi:hypothetical protein
MRAGPGQYPGRQSGSSFDGFLSVCLPFPDAYPKHESATVRGVTDGARFTAGEELDDASQAQLDPDLLIGWGLTCDSDLPCSAALRPAFRRGRSCSGRSYMGRLSGRPPHDRFARCDPDGDS